MQTEIQKNTKGRTLLVDGDILVYRMGFAVEKTKYCLTTKTGPNGEDELWDIFDSKKDVPDVPGAELWSRKALEPIENALHLINQFYDKLNEQFQPKQIQTFLSGEYNPRNAVAVTKIYKGNRTAEKPTYYKDIRSFLVSACGATVADGLEADDAIGIALLLDPTSIVVSIDKDLLQLKGTHYNWVKDEITEVSERDAILNLYTQLLTGDATDNVPGLPGVGPAAASKILAGVNGKQEAWQRVVQAYVEANKDYKYLHEQYQLLKVPFQERLQNQEDFGYAYVQLS